MAAETEMGAADRGGILLLRRIKRNAWIALVLMTLGSLYFLSFPITLGVVIGGLLAIINFRWMEGGLDAALGQPMVARKRSQAVVKFVLRFVLLGVVIYAIVASRIADLKALLAGLFVFVLSIMGEAASLAIRSFRKADRNHTSLE